MACLSAWDVAQIFMNNVFKLHNMPRTIPSDRDVVFTSKLGRELFKMQKVSRWAVHKTGWTTPTSPKISDSVAIESNLEAQILLKSSLFYLVVGQSSSTKSRPLNENMDTIMLEMLIKEFHKAPEDNTWEDLLEFQSDFLILILKDKDTPSHS